MTYLPLVSIVTVCYNSELFLQSAIDSVLSQDYPNIQYIIVDGASTDRTSSILKHNSGSIDTLLCEPDDGIYDAMNKGISLARGSIIGFLNSDDFYPNINTITKVVDSFLHSSSDCVYGNLCYVSQFNSSRILRLWRSSAFSPAKFRTGWVPPHPSFFVKSNVYKSFGLFDLSYSLAADFELMFRFLVSKNVSSFHLNSVIVHMRLGGETNKSFRNIVRQNLEIFRVFRSYRYSVNAFIFIFSKLVRKLRERFSVFISRP